MSECIVRMEMPKSCYECEMRGAWAFCPIGKWPVVCYKKQRHEDCPILAVLPEKHGRLVDADALLRDIEKYHVSEGKFKHWLELQPTIVPAEMSETCLD